MEENPNWSRRRFLTPRGLGTSVGGFLAALLPEETHSEIDPQQRTGYWCVTRRAMACEFTVFLPPSVGEPMNPGEAALDEIDRMEDLLTVYRQTSDLSYVNANASSRPVKVDGRLYQILKRSAELSKDTDYAFDVATGQLIKTWGFFKGSKRVPSPGEIEKELVRSSMKQVTIDHEATSVRYHADGLEINLGSIGKGYALDRALALLRGERGIHDGLIQGGTSSIAAMGNPPGDPRGWMVGLANPYDANQRLATVFLRNRALGTSGDAEQYFECDGRRYGHVLDPRTGYPVDNDLASASVVARNGTDADALATALFVMGLDKATDFCKNHPEVGGLLVLKPEPGAPAETSPRVIALNLSREDFDLNLNADTKRRTDDRSETRSEDEAI